MSILILSFPTKYFFLSTFTKFPQYLGTFETFTKTLSRIFGSVSTKLMLTLKCTNQNLFKIKSKNQNMAYPTLPNMLHEKAENKNLLFLILSFLKFKETISVCLCITCVSLSFILSLLQGIKVVLVLKKHKHRFNTF